jgi:dehydrogenase/reductase SDR family member 12
MNPPKSALAAPLDCALEASVVGSFSRFGYLVRRTLWQWDPPPALPDKTIMVTGASSGIGRAAAIGLARCGAKLCLTGRNAAELEETARRAKTAGADSAETFVLDIIDAVGRQRLAAWLRERVDRVHALVNCAGALFPTYQTTATGEEMTVATNLLGPFALTQELSPLLHAADGSAIVTVSSGGMYTQRFSIDGLEIRPDDYRGAVAYARTKRAQVVLTREWARRWGDAGVLAAVMHPGWCDTPGLRTSLPGFSRLGPLLRTSAEGADTVVWLVATALSAAGPALPRDSPGIWLDRRCRSAYYLPHTRPDAARAAVEGSQLWEWCEARV